MLELLVLCYLKLFDGSKSIQSNKIQRLNSNLIACLFLLLNETTSIYGASRSLDPILWSMQNEMFKSDTTQLNDFVIEVKLGEFLNIICPHSLPTSATKSQSIGNGNEYHILYKVSKEEYDECSIKHAARTIMKCDKPNENLKYTLYISSFSPVPDALEFTPGKSYYFISTSDGTPNGLNNLVGGSCRTNHMKFVIKVLDAGSRAGVFNQKSKPKKSSKELKTLNLPTTTILMPIHRKASKSLPLVSLHVNSEQMSKSPLQTSTKYNNKNSTKTVISKNDDIFLLEPDSIDYGDLLSQFITIGSGSNSNNSEKKLKNKLLTDDNIIRGPNNSASLKEYELTNSSCSRSKPIWFYFELTSCFLWFFHVLFFNKLIFS